MAEVGIEATINRWDEPLALGVVDPHDSLSHPAGVSDVQAESATRLDPDQFTNFLVCFMHLLCLFAEGCIASASIFGIFFFGSFDYYFYYYWVGFFTQFLLELLHFCDF